MPGFQTLFDPSQENLEMRLAEAEAYQKILEQQIKVCIALNVTVLIKHLPSLSLPFKCLYHYRNSPYWSPYILLTTSWENLSKH